MTHPRKPLSVLRGMLALALLLFGLLPLAAPAPAAAAKASLSLSRDTAAPGDSVAATGSGFQPNDNAVLFATFSIRNGPKSVSKQQLTTSAHVNGSGGFTATFTVPHGAVPGPYRIAAHDFHNNTAAQRMQVLRLVQLTSGKQGPNASIVAGHYFYVAGSGFKAGETVTITADFPLYGGNTLTETKTATADKNGGFGEVKMQVPWRAQNGDLSLSATGQQSGKSAAATAKLSVIHQPFVWLSSKTVRPGGSVTVHGGGFVPGAQVTASVTISRPGSTNVTLNKTVTAGNQGEFQASLQVPSNVGQGTYTVTATGSEAKFHASTPLKVTLSAGIAVQPGSTQPGQKVTVTGTGYSAGVQVQVSATVPLFGGGNKTISTTVTTNGNGEFSTQLQVPTQAAAGDVTVTAKGPSAQSTAKLKILHIGSGITVTPSTARPGSDVTIQGSGFLAGATINISLTVKLTSGATQTLRTKATTNGKGQFSVKLRIPGNAVGGSYTLTARSAESGRTRTAKLAIGNVAPSLAVSPVSTIPGSNVSVKGSGYLAGTKITVSLPVKLTSGATKTVTTSVTTNGSGQFSTTLQVPGDVAGGTYTVTARSEAGRESSGKLVVAVLKPSVVVVPTVAIPGTQITVNGFGFAAGETVTLDLQGTKLGTATTSGSGQFKTTVTVPATTSTGNYTLSAASSSGRKASIGLAVNRKIATHFYFASLYTGKGYHEYLLFMNQTEIKAKVQITYQPTVGATKSKSIVVGAHSRFTEDVNADVGSHVSTAAAVSSDAPIVAQRLVTHYSDGAIVPGATHPATSWYFANGNTSHGYREYVAVQNPNSGPVQVAVHLLPTHHRPFTVYRTMRPTSRTTFKINSYVRDAVGVTITANGPVVANRSVFVRHGMTSKIGMQAPQKSWYFAAGPRRGSTRHWIGVINTSGHRSYITLHAYGQDGRELGTVKAWLKPFAREGYLMNKVAGVTDVAVVLTTSQPSIAEQTTYLGGQHDAATDAFGVVKPARTWEFAAANTYAGQHNTLTLFNPNLVPVPVVVQFMNASGSKQQRTYVLSPLSHQWIDVGSVMPNSQSAILAASNYPFVALDRQLINNGAGAMTSTGFHG